MIKLSLHIQSESYKKRDSVVKIIFQNAKKVINLMHTFDLCTVSFDTTISSCQHSMHYINQHLSVLT